MTRAPTPKFGHCDTEEEFLEYCKSQDQECDLSAGELQMLIGIIERLRGKPIAVSEERC